MAIVQAIKEFWKVWLICFGGGMLIAAIPHPVIVRLLDIAVWAWPVTLIAFFIFFMIGVHQGTVERQGSEEES